MHWSLAFIAAGSVGLGATAGRRRLLLSQAKHRSLAGHSKWSRRIARLIPAIDYDARHFFRCDGAPEEIVAKREQGLERLAAVFTERFPKGRKLTAETRAGLSDLQFTGSYRVPFQFAKLVCEKLGVSALSSDRQA